MSRFSIVAAASLILLGSQVSWAGGDKVAEAFVDPVSVAGGTNGFSNLGVSTGKMKSGKCLIQVQFKGLSGIADGEQLICIAGADIHASLLGASSFGNSVVMRAEVKSGGAKLKADLKKIGCGSDNAVSFNGSLSCYKPDSDYSDPDPGNAGTNWSEVCSTSGTLMFPIANGDVAPPAIDPGAKKDGLLGLCQGFTADAGERIDPPASGLVATQGQSNPAF